MAKVKRIFLGHGELKKVAEHCEMSYATVSKYLRGLYDEKNEKSSALANEAREVALRMGGVMEK